MQESSITLDEYLYQNRMTVRQFCKQIDYSPNHIYGVMSGKLKAGDKLERIIEKATSGRVTRQYLLTNPVPEVEKNTGTDLG